MNDKYYLDDFYMYSLQKLNEWQVRLVRKVPGSPARKGYAAYPSLRMNEFTALVATLNLHVDPSLSFKDNYVFNKKELKDAFALAITKKFP